VDRDDLITRLAVLETGYLTLRRDLESQGDRLKILEASERSWAIWAAKVGMVPALASVLLALVSVAASFSLDSRADKLDKAVARLQQILPKSQ
jgi:hypothetical protein